MRHYFINVLNVTQVSDVLDYETGEPFTPEKWEGWIRVYHSDARATSIRGAEVERRVEQIAQVVAQIPDWILAEIKESEEHEFEEGEMVALMTPDAQDEEGDRVVYARWRDDPRVGT